MVPVGRAVRLGQTCSGRLPDTFLLPGEESIHDPRAWLMEGVFFLSFFYFHDLLRLYL
jgi:hypothetical protein